MKYLIVIAILFFSASVEAAGIKKIDGVTFAYTASIDGVALENIASVDGQAPVKVAMCGLELVHTNSIQPNRHYLFRCQASLTGTVLNFKLYSTDTGNAKITVYAGDVAAASNLLSQNIIGQGCTAGWNTLDIDRFTITSGVYYWIGGVSDVANVFKYGGNAGYLLTRKNDVLYSTFSPASPYVTDGDVADASMAFVLYGYAE